ncbi:MAG TPA: DUF3224 domain-containing protein [Chloroflexota bacterium]|nr:DUF3224 domain-containing protein [Chloroflexota bacterium]
MRAVADFNVDSFDPVPSPEGEDAARHGRVRIEKTFHGDIEGHGSVEMLAVRGDAGSGYVAIEHISGSVNGLSGGFSLLHIGTMAGTEQWGHWPLIPGSGTGDLRTIRGEGRIENDAAGNHGFTLDYELDMT